MRSLVYKKLHTFQKFQHHLRLGLYFSALFTICASSKNGEMGLFRQQFKAEVKFVTQKTTQACTICRGLWNLPQKFHLSLIVMFQAEFNNSCLANLDINSLTDDIVEDIMLQSKPLQVILLAIRNRQKVKNDMWIQLCKQNTWNWAS